MDSSTWGWSYLEHIMASRMKPVQTKSARYLDRKLRDRQFLVRQGD